MRRLRLHTVLTASLLSGMLLAPVSCRLQSDATPSALPHRAAEDSLEREVRRLNRKGTGLRNDSQYKEALRTHFEALDLAKKIHDTTGQIFALNNIGTDLRRTASNSEASTYHYAALELCGDSPAHRKSRAVAMNGLGNIFLSLNKPDQALGYLQESLQIEKELESQLGQAMNLANIAEAFQCRNELDSAQHYFTVSLKENQHIRSEIGVALCKKSLGKISLKQGRTSEGLKLIAEAVELLNRSKDAYHRAEIEIAFCEALMENGRWDEAESHLNEVLSLARKTSSYDQLYTANSMLERLKEKQLKHDEALQAGRRAMAYRDSILS